MSIVKDKIDLIQRSEETLSSALTNVDDELALELVRLLVAFKVGDSLLFDPQRAAELELQILQIIRNSTYKKTIDAYIKDFDAITELNKALHKVENGLDINRVVNENARLAAFLSDIESQLRGTPTSINGRNPALNQLIQPISNLIRKDIIIGTNFDTAVDHITKAISGRQIGLERWAKQITQDALRQYDGLQQQQVKEELDLKYIKYAGGLKSTTRPFCYHMLLYHQTSSEEEIKAVLDEFCPGGIPSKSITSETANGKPQRKGSGMIPGTDISNFLIYAGGFGCLHQAIPSPIPDRRSEKQKAENREKLINASSEMQVELN